jgi:hypothetical protein
MLECEVSIGFYVTLMLPVRLEYETGLMLEYETGKGSKLDSTFFMSLTLINFSKKMFRFFISSLVPVFCSPDVIFFNLLVIFINLSLFNFNY